MTNAIEESNKWQHLATVLRREQHIALEMLLLGYSDIEIAESISVRRETIWKWKHRDPKFQAELSARKATMTNAAAERLNGMLDQAVSVVQKSLHSSKADPKLAMSLLGSLGVLDLARELGRGEAATASGSGVDEADGDAEVERVLEAVEVETGELERQVGAGE